MRKIAWTALFSAILVIVALVASFFDPKIGAVVALCSLTLAVLSYRE